MPDQRVKQNPRRDHKRHHKQRGEKPGVVTSIDVVLAGRKDASTFRVVCSLTARPQKCSDAKLQRIAAPDAAAMRFKLNKSRPPRVNRPDDLFVVSILAEGLKS